MFSFFLFLQITPGVFNFHVQLLLVIIAVFLAARVSSDRFGSGGQELGSLDLRLELFRHGLLDLFGKKLL